MFCSKCGAQLEEGARFCTSCGAAVADAEEGAVPYAQAGPAAQPYAQAGPAAQPGATQQFQAAPPQQPYQPQRQSHVLPVAAAVCGTLAVVAIGFAAYTMGRNSGADAASTAAISEAAASTEAATTGAATTVATTSAASEAAATEQATQVTNNTTIIIDGQTHSVPVQSSGYILPQSNSRYYSKSELSSLSLNDLWIARNEIYARHGRGFRDEALQDYFNRQSWYTYRYSPDEFDSMSGVLNDYEIANADTIKSIEQERGSSHLQ